MSPVILPRERGTGGGRVGSPTAIGERGAVVDPIPLVDLRAQHAAVADEIAAGWADVLERSAFVLGDEVRAFEEAFASYCGVRHCIGVASGTDALELILRAADVRPGDEVVVPTNSFTASAMAVVRAGATPILVDVDPSTYLIDVERVADRVGSRTRAIMAVHLYGQAAPVEQLRDVAGDRCALIEDAAQAHGARRIGKPAGALGVAAATSFYPSKNLGAYGDAGAVLTSSDEIVGAVVRLRNHGGERKYEHARIGFNSRLDTLQAVVLSAKLPHLAEWNAARREAAARYDDLLEDLEEVTRPTVLLGNEHVWHLYVVRVPRRDEVLQMLVDAGIGAAIHYPVPIHLQEAFSYLGHRRGDFPVAEQAAREILSLPIYPEISAEQQERIVDELRKAIR